MRPIAQLFGKVAVTGATGNVGSEVVKALHQQGANVVALVSSSSIAPTTQRPGSEFRAFNYSDSGTWQQAVAGCVSLFLLRPPAISDVEATLNPFVRLALASGVQHVVFLSVAGADTNKLVPHHKVETFLKTTKSYTILRPGFFAQNLQDAYRRDIIEDDRIYVPAGKGKAAFVDLRDVATVAAQALTKPSDHQQRGYTLTGPIAAPFAAVAEALTQHLDRTIQYVPASMAGYLWHLRQRKLPFAQALVQTILHVGLRFGQAERVDPTMERLLGCPPRSIYRYVSDHAHLWPSNPRTR